MPAFPKPTATETDPVASPTAAAALALAGTKAAKASNLSDLADASAARTNLGLGTAATTAASAYATAAQGTKADNAATASALTTETTNRTAADATLTANTQTGDYTLVLADAGKVVEVNAATAKVVTVPPSVFSVGTVIEVFRYGAGTVTLAAGSGVTIRSRGSLLAVGNQYSSVALRQRATDEWVLVGDLA